MSEFYEYQKKRTLILLGWGLGNVAVGTLGLVVRPKSKGWLHFWLQAIGWGGINAAIARVGLTSQSKKIQAQQQDETAPKGSDSDSRTKKDIAQYHRVLYINACVDLGYIGLGGAISRTWWAQFDAETRKGVALGVLAQGFALFCYDALLAREVKRQWLAR